MNEAKLTELLERAAEQTAVSPPPIDAMRSGATRRRRRRTAVFSAAGTAIAVAAVITTTTVLTGGGPTATPQPSVAATQPKPVGNRVVAIGAVGVTVPASWGTNELKCGTPSSDTVIIDPSRLVPYCLIKRPANVESVWLARTPGVEFHADKAVTVGGMPAQQQATRCIHATGELGSANQCTGAIWIPMAKVWVQAQSSGDAAVVERQLKQIHVLIDSPGVPGFRSAEIDGSVTKYTAELQRAGFKWTLSGSGKKVLAVSPAVGTPTEFGSTVTVTVGP